MTKRFEVIVTDNTHTYSAVVGHILAKSEQAASRGFRLTYPEFAKSLLSFRCVGGDEE